VTLKAHSVFRTSVRVVGSAGFQPADGRDGHPTLGSLAAFAAVLLLTACGGGGVAAPAPAAALASSSPASAAAKPASFASASAAASAKPAASPAASGQLRKVTWGYATLTGTFMPTLVGKEGGVFAKHGIDLDVNYTRDGQTAMTALISGQMPFVTLADPSVTTSALRGADGEWVAVNVPAPHLVMYSQPNINSVEDLKGKKIGVTTLGALTALMARYIVEQHGLDPQKDVTLLAVGGGPEALAAIASGQIDAIVTAPENPAPGKKVLVDMTKLGYPFPQAGLVTTKSMVKKDPPLVQDMVQSFAESTQLFKTNRALSEQVLAKTLKDTLKNSEVVAKNYEGTASALSTDVTPKAAEIQSVLDLIAPTTPQAKDAKPQDFFDDTFAKKVVLPSASAS
jgi:NitT/TauT family transport system substrate-binding protein